MEQNDYSLEVKELFLRFFHNIHKLITANILCLLCCIPVVTAGAAIYALNDICKRCVFENRTDLFSDFFHAFKSNFRRSTSCWIVFLPLIALNLGALFLYYQMRHLNSIYTISFFISCISFYFVITSFVFANMMMDVADFSISTVLKNAFALTILECKRGIPVFIGIILLSFLVFLLFPISALFVVFFYCSICSFLSNAILIPQLIKRKIITIYGYY